MIEFIKFIGKYLIPFGTNAIMSGIAAEATKNASTLGKISAQVASFAISAAVTEVATEAFDKQVDEIGTECNKLLGTGNKEEAN